jgi:curved DNA-binding protein CbpA
MPLKELITVSGLPDSEALKIIYALALSNHIVREEWKKAFRDEQTPSEEHAPEPSISEREEPTEVDEKDLAVLLDRIESATTFYDVLSITNNASAADLKQAYYDLARRYHPDRFRRKDLGPLQDRLESAFARITQAYETLGDQTSRANYDSRLEARARSRSTSEKQVSGAAAPTSPATAGGSFKDKAEQSFMHGLAALKSGETKKAVAHFGFAVQACPNEARYHAFYGEALSTFDNSRHQAEVELQAALKLEPNNPDYRIMLAQLYKTLGFTKRARAEAERALASAPHHEGAKVLLRDLP